METYRLNELPAFQLSENSKMLSKEPGVFFERITQKLKTDPSIHAFYVIFDWSSVDMFSSETVVSRLKQCLLLTDQGGILVVKAAYAACFLLKAMSFGIPALITHDLASVDTGVDYDEKSFLWGNHV